MTTHASFRALHSVKALVLAVGVCAALLPAATSQAQITTYDDTTEATFNALGVTDVTLTGTEGDTFITYTVTVGSQTLKATNNGNGTSQYIERRDQKGFGGLFGGNFPAATPLLRNFVGTAASAPADGLVITFSSPVSAFGFNYDPTLPGPPTDFTFEVFEGGITPVASPVSLGDVNTGQTPGNPLGPNDVTAPFFGISEAGGNKITSIRIFGAPGGAPTNTTPNDFAVGLLRFKVSPAVDPPTVPEPGSIALLMGMAVTGAGCLTRRKRIAPNR